MFMALKETCQPLFAYNMRTRMRTLIVTNEPKLLQQDGKINFNGNLYWYCKFVRDNLNWSYKKFTWTTRKLPKDWKQQGLKITYKVCKSDDLLHSKGVIYQRISNWQILSSNMRNLHMRKKWLKYIVIYEAHDKRRIIVFLSSTTGNVLPFQIVITITTTKCLPPLNVGWIACKKVGWHYTYFVYH